MIECFVFGVTARTAADMLNIHPNTAALFYTKIRQLIVFRLEKDIDRVFGGTLDIDERYLLPIENEVASYSNMFAVFALLKHAGRVYIKMIDGKIEAEANDFSVVPKIAPNSVVYIKNYHSSRSLDVAEFYHYKVHQQYASNYDNYYAEDIEQFWNQTTHILKRYNGIPQKSLLLFLKECEFKCNYGSLKQQLKCLQDWAEIEEKLVQS